MAVNHEPPHSVEPVELVAVLVQKRRHPVLGAPLILVDPVGGGGARAGDGVRLALRSAAVARRAPSSSSATTAVMYLLRSVSGPFVQLL